MIKNTIYRLFFILLVTYLVSCRAKDDNPGLEYAPNMYHSVPYEGLSQITDKDQGKWLSSREDGQGEYYNSNIYNPHNMNMRTPPEHTVPRSKDGFLPYRLPKDSLDYAATHVFNPLDSTVEVVAQGKELFSIYCMACHGEKGDGKGPISEVFAGIPAYNKGRVQTLPEGHIFHVITHGKNLMGAHGSMIGIEERWKIVRYVQTLQNQQ